VSAIVFFKIETKYYAQYVEYATAECGV